MAAFHKVGTRSALLLLLTWYSVIMFVLANEPCYLIISFFSLCVFVGVFHSGVFLKTHTSVVYTTGRIYHAKKD